MSARVVERRRHRIGDREDDVERVEVPDEDVPLLELLEEIVDEHVEGRMAELLPSKVAVECDDLVEAEELLRDVERGNVPIGGVGYGMSYTLRFARGIEEYREGRETATLAAVGCSGSKHEDDGLLPARDRYAKGYWTCKERYGDVVPDDWRIISARFSVLHPDEEILDYDRSVDDLEGVPIDAAGRLPNGDDVETLLDQWAVTVYEQLAEWIDEAAGGPDPRDVDLEVLLGKGYRRRLEERGVFDRLPAPATLDVSFPFQEQPEAQGGQGYQMQWMNGVVEDARTAEA